LSALDSHIIVGRYIKSIWPSHAFCAKIKLFEQKNKEAFIKSFLMNKNTTPEPAAMIINVVVVVGLTTGLMIAESSI
jgi:hypothetical protein